MGVGAISLVSPGAITAPTSLTAVVSSALTTVFKDYGLSDVIPLPSLKALLWCNGLDFQYHVLDGAQYLNGPLAPGVAPTAVSTATQATVVMTFTGVPTDGSIIQIGKPGVTLNGTAIWKSTLDPTLAMDQIKIVGGDQDACMTNLYEFINGTGVQGTDFYSARMATFGYDKPSWDVENDIEASAIDTTANTLTLRAKTYGPVGNSYLAIEVIADGAYSFPTAVFSGGAAGTKTNSGAAPSNGTYKHGLARFRDDDFAQTAISPISTTQNGGNVDMTISWTEAAPTRDGISHTRIFRSTVGGGSQFYRAGDDATSPFTDTLPDTTITGDFAVQYDGRFKRPFTAGYPTRRRFGTIYRGSAFMAGVHPHGKYSIGTVSVTNASTTATFSATTKFKTDVIGMDLLVTDDSIAYTVVDFVEATRVATLNRAYAGGTNGTAGYVLSDPRNPFAIDYSVANLFNDWPPGQNIEGVSSSDPTGITGIVTSQDTLIAFTRTGMFRIEGSPETLFRIVPVAEGCGAYTNQAVLNIEGLLLWLGPDGIYEWGGGGTPSSLSNPTEAEAGVSKGIAQTLARINPEQVGQIVANYNRTGNIVRWFVPLDGSPWNSHAIVLDLQTGAFSLDKVPPVTAAWSETTPTGDFVTVVGTAFGEVIQLDVGTSDGAYGFDPVAAYSSYSAATKTVTLTTTPLPTSGDGLKGVAVLKVDATGGVEWGYISTNTSGTFATVTPFTTAPTTGDVFIFGGIEWRLESSRCDYGSVESRKRLSSVHASFAAQTVAGQVWCYGAKGQDTGTVFNLRSSGVADYANLSALWAGGKRYDLHKGADRRQMFGFMALCPGFDVKLLSWKAEIDARTEVRA